MNKVRGETAIEIIPAVDLRKGRCVRLYQGDYDQETVFSEDPVEVALQWQSQGTSRLHVVDLDGAATGEIQNIGIITGPMDWREARQRELGWREALVENNHDVDESYIVNGDWSPSSGERSIRLLLEWHPEIDAVFVCNDQMALGAMKVAQKMGRKIPEDLAVVGFDDIPESPYFSPALSTIRQDTAEMGYQGVQQLYVS